MNPQEGVPSPLEHEKPDPVPTFEISIDEDSAGELGDKDLQRVHVKLGLDCTLIPNQYAAGSKASTDRAED